MLANDDEINCNLKSYIPLTIGSRVMIINNICTPLGLANGTQGTVVGFLYADNNKYEQDNYLLPHYAKENHDVCNTGQKKTKRELTLPIVLVKMDVDTYKGDSYDID